MKIHRFILDIPLDEPKALVIDPHILKQWRDVLRFKTGDKVLLCNGQGWEALAQFEGIDKGGARLKLAKPVQVEREPKREVTLYCSILKRENFEWVVQKAVEVGVSRIVPVLSERTVKKEIRLDRLRKIITEAAEQSGRGVLPILHEMIPLPQALLETTRSEISFLFDGSGPAFESELIRHKSSVGIFIGPEGGWSEKELELTEKSGLAIVNLGPLTLRAETAAVIATYIVTQ